MFASVAILVAPARSSLADLVVCCTTEPSKGIDPVILMIFSTTWVAVSSIVIVTTLLSAMPGTAWQCRICDFPRAQILTIGAALLAGGFALILAGQSLPGAWASLPLFALLGLAVTIQASWAIRLTPLISVEIPSAPIRTGSHTKVPAEGTLRIVTANVDYTNRDPDRALELLIAQRPHVLAIVENTDDWTSRLEALADSFPWHVIEPRPDGRGVALLARVPLRATHVECLVSQDRPSIWGLAQVQGIDVGIGVLHPAPPGLPRRRGGRKDSTERDIELHVAAERVRSAVNKLPWIVTGDFNDVGWSRTTEHFKRISGLGDPRIGRGTFNTFPASWPLIRYPIDHVMLSTALRIVSLRRLPNIGSDHLPLLADVRLNTAPVWENADRQRKPESKLVYNACSGETIAQ